MKLKEQRACASLRVDGEKRRLPWGKKGQRWGPNNAKRRKRKRKVSRDFFPVRSSKRAPQSPFPPLFPEKGPLAVAKKKKKVKETAIEVPLPPQKGGVFSAGEKGKSRRRKKKGSPRHFAVPSEKRGLSTSEKKGRG